MPCHEKEVKQPAEHGHHEAGSKGNECIACHMPMTRFAAMGRTDHSMRPPTPAATIAFKSPNACNLCHADHDAAWADQWVRKWYPDDYQAEVLRRAELIDLARKRQWKRLPEMLAELQKKDGDEVYKTSLVRLLGGCEDESKWPVLLGRLQDPSPLVRSSAASALGGHLTPEVLDGPAGGRRRSVAAGADSHRDVAGSAAAAIADQRARSGEPGKGEPRFHHGHAGPAGRLGLARQPRQLLHGAAATSPRPSSCFETATKLEPRQIGPMVNASMAYSNMGQNDKAEQSLRRALKMEPDNAAANFNLGLLLGEQGRLQEAEQALRTALKADPQMAAAAYNLGVILGEKNLDEAIAWCQKAHDLRPADPKYAHTLAFYQRKKGNIDGAVELLRKAIQRRTVLPRRLSAARRDLRGAA